MVAGIPDNKPPSVKDLYPAVLVHALLYWSTLARLIIIQEVAIMHTENLYNMM